MIAVHVRGLEAGDTVPEVDPLDEPELVEALESPVDARDPHARAIRANAVVDLLCREAAVLLADVLDDEASRAAASPRCLP